LGDVSPKSLYNWRKDGSLRYVKLGTRTMYRPEDLADFIARQQQKGGAA
jgi:predicted site-specific integrase-resolvase